jgi:hypothetical protein
MEILAPDGALTGSDTKEERQGMKYAVFPVPLPPTNAVTPPSKAIFLGPCPKQRNLCMEMLSIFISDEPEATTLKTPLARQSIHQ